MPRVGRVAGVLFITTTGIIVVREAYRCHRNARAEGVAGIIVISADEVAGRDHRSPTRALGTGPKVTHANSGPIEGVAYEVGGKRGTINDIEPVIVAQKTAIAGIVL